MTKPGTKISASEILKDIQSGMDDAQLMAKYGLSLKGLESTYGKLRKAGLLKPLDTPGPIPRDKSLVPVRKVPNDLVGSRRDPSAISDKLDRSLDASRMMSLMESKSHLWLIALGLVVTAVGAAAYLGWPFLQSLWLDEIELARSLGYSTPLERTHDIWFLICNRGGPTAVFVGSMLSLAGLIVWVLKRFKLSRMLAKRTQSIGSAPSKGRPR